MRRPFRGQQSEVAEDGPCDKRNEYRYRGPAAVGKAPQQRVRTRMRRHGKSRHSRYGKEQCGIVIPRCFNIAVHKCMQRPKSTAAGAVVSGEHVRRTTGHPSGVLRVENEDNDEGGHDDRSNQCHDQPPHPRRTRHKQPPPMPQPLRARYRRRGVVRKSHPSLHCQAPKSRLNQRNDNAAYDADYNCGYGPNLGVL